MTTGKAQAAPSRYGVASNAQQGWEDQQHHAQQQGYGGHQTNGVQPMSPGAQPPEALNCDCGLQCSYIMAKTAKNDGRWFYRCGPWYKAGCGCTARAVVMCSWVQNILACVLVRDPAACCFSAGVQSQKRKGNAASSSGQMSLVNSRSQQVSD